MRKSCLLLSGLVSLVLVTEVHAAEALDGVLKDYVNKLDASYGWTKRMETKIGKTTVVELTLTSQTWRDTPWRHQLFIIKPSTLKAKTKHALLFIGGGRWRDAYAQAPANPDLPREARLLAPVVEQLGTPVAVLLQVPQQPMFDGLVEDQLISLTFE